MKYLNSLVLLLLISCGGGEVRRDSENVPYRTSGVEQFFLPELPTWTNFSSSGQCFKSSSFHYLDFSKLSSQYQLSYVEMIELQAQYNERIENYFRSTAVRFLKPVEEASFFSNTLEQVRGGVRHIKLPKVTDVDVIWIDSFLQENKMSELKKMMEAGRFNENLPLLFSSCLSHQGLVQLVAENNLEDAGFYFLSAETLSAFGSDFVLKPGLRVELAKIFDPKIKFKLLTSNPKLLPTEIVLP